jgi:hypothetical protein
MATWSLCGRHVGPDKPPTPVFINLDKVLTVERQGDRWAKRSTLKLCRRRLLALSLPRVLYSLHA